MPTVSRTAPFASGRLPLVGHTLAMLRDPIGFFQAQRERGDLVRLRLNPYPTYLINSVELIREILVDHAHDFGRGRNFDKAIPVWGHGLVSVEGQQHRRQRRIMQPAFHRDRIATYVETMRAEITRLVAAWQPGQRLAMDEAMAELTLRVTTKNLFSADLGATAVDDVGRELPVVLEGVYLRTVLPDWWGKLPIPANRRFDRACAELKRVVDEVIDAYQAAGVQHEDLLSGLLSARYEDTGEPMSREQIRDELRTLLIAGTETTATTLSWLCHELGRHPEIQDRLRTEIRTVLGDRPITMADLPKLEYLDRVLNETLRRHNPIWLMVRKANTAVDLGGVTIEPGAEVIYSLATLLRDPALFPDPLRFDPDRWLTADPAVTRAAFIPFSTGNHKCIGDTFAWTEMAVAIATIVARWQLSPVPGTQVVEQARIVLRPNRVDMTITPAP
jgi:cytochrome P450